MRKIAVTGGLSCGKSTVCLFLKDLGAYVVSADSVVHHLLAYDDLVSHQVIRLLGQEILTDGRIDRKKIAEIVFSNPVKLKELEKILHPETIKEIFRQYEQVKNNPSYIFFAAEIPLLYEAGMEKLFDEIIYVSANKEIARSRSPQKIDFETRMNYQKNILDKQVKPNFVIANDGDLVTLKKNVTRIVEQLKEHFSE